MKQKFVYGMIFTSGVLVLLGVFFYFDYLKYHPNTDDAYIDAIHVQVSSKIAGEVMVLNVAEGQYVNKGDLLFQIDPKSYELELAAAQAKLKIAQNKLNSEKSALLSASNEIARAKAQLVLARKKAEATQPLVEKRYLARIEGDQVEMELKVAQSGLALAQHKYEELENEFGYLGENNAALQAAQAALGSAELSLNNTKYVAPISGYVTKFNLHRGDLVSPGAPLFVLIDNSYFWVNANFKETQLPYIKVGEKALITVDMEPGVELVGKVSSIGYGSQNSFSLLPAQNATGTWVKITQRFPVKIQIQHPTKDFSLRVGASCSVSIQP